jgi:hypothetical protein
MKRIIIDKMRKNDDYDKYFNYDSNSNSIDCKLNFNEILYYNAYVMLCNIKIN